MYITSKTNVSRIYPHSSIYDQTKCSQAFFLTNQYISKKILLK